jgi:hypothetical protein
MTKCDSTFVSGECPGHLGKFQSCRDKAIWWQSLDQSFVERETGDVEFRGYFALMNYPVAENVDVDLATDDRIVTVPAGWYIAESDNSGAVYVTLFEDEAVARNIMDEEEADYIEWADDE